MQIKSGKLAKFSLIINLILICLITFFVLKRWRFQYELDHPKTLPSYLDNPQYVEQLKIEPAYTRLVKIIMLGNSHVYKAHWDELLNRGDVGNRGIGSDITEGYLHRLEYVFDSKPDICFIEGGANDIWYHIPIDTTIHNLSLLIDTLRKANIIPILHQLVPFSIREPRSNKFNSSVVEVNKRIVLLAHQKKVDCIDLYSVLSENGYLAPQYSQQDGCHLTAFAYVKWKNEIEKILVKYHI